MNALTVCVLLLDLVILSCYFASHSTCRSETRVLYRRNLEFGWFEARIGQTFRVFVLLEDGDGIETVFAPFDTLQALARFRGVAVVLRDKDVINLGNLPVRFR